MKTKVFIAACVAAYWYFYTPINAYVKDVLKKRPVLESVQISFPRFLYVVGDSNTNPSYSWVNCFAQNYYCVVEKNTSVGAAFKDFLLQEYPNNKLIVVALGTNFAKDTLSVSKFFQNLQNYSNKVLVVAPFNQGKDFDVLREKLQEICKTQQFYYVDVHDKLQKSDFADKYHLSKKGHQNFAVYVNQAFIKSIISKPLKHE